MRITFLFLAVFLFGSASAHADSVDFTLLNPAQSISSNGGILLFSATVSASASNTGSEDLNSLEFNINPMNTFVIDESGFLNSFPLSLDPGQSYTGTLFGLLVPVDSASGMYGGSVVLDGGTANNALGTQTFSVNVTSSAAPTPEPSSFLLLGTGVIAMATSFRLRLEH